MNVQDCRKFCDFRDDRVMAFSRRAFRILLSILLYRTTMSFLCHTILSKRGRSILSIDPRMSNFHSSVLRPTPPSSLTAIYSDADEVVREVEPSTPSYLELKPTDHEILALYDFLRTKKNVLVITGAGISTSSGVPDYRGPLGSYKLGDTLISTSTSFCR